MSEIDKHEFINIAILENIIEAQLIDSILNEQNIPHMIRSFHDTAYDGLFQFQMSSHPETAQKGGLFWPPINI